MSIFKVPLTMLRSLESIRCQFFNGHELKSNKSSWVKWNSVLAAKEKGGLGVSSLFALNRALLMKWFWRFYSHNDSLWSRVIKAIYGVDGEVNKVSKYASRSCWRDIINEVRKLKDQGINMRDFMYIKVGNGETTKFWDDIWIGSKPLKLLFPRIYALDNIKDASICMKLNEPSLDNNFRRSIRGGIEQSQFKSDKLRAKFVLGWLSNIRDVNSFTEWINGGICRGHILNGMSDVLFDVYQNMGLAKELRRDHILNLNKWAEDASFTQHGLNMDESIYVSSIIDKLPPSWKDFQNTFLKHKQVEGSRNEIGPQYSYSYSIEEDPRTFDEAMQSHEVSFWKEAINDEMDSITENNTWILSDLPPGCKPLGCKWIFKRKMKVDGTIDKLLIALAATYNLVIHQMDVKTGFLNGDLEEEVYMKQSEVFIMPGNEHKKFKCDDCCPVNTPLDPTIKLMPNTSMAVDQLEYSRAIGCLMYVMISTRPDIAYAVGKLSRYTSNPSTHHWHAIMRVFKYLKKTTDYGLSYVGFPSVLEGYFDAS
ncbi:zinc finger, CCHC-type containing protein [Tanacetum coccineum]